MQFVRFDLGPVDFPAALYTKITDPTNIILLETAQYEKFVAGAECTVYGGLENDRRAALRIPHDGDWVVVVHRWGLGRPLKRRGATVKVSLCELHETHGQYFAQPVRTSSCRLGC